MITLEGRLQFDEKTNIYAVSIPMMGVWTQGNDYEDAIAMAKDAIQMMFEDLDFTLVDSGVDKNIFHIRTDDKAIYGIVLKAARQSSGLSLAEAANKLGYKNHNSIYVYETGKKQPSMAQFFKLMKAYNCEWDLVARVA